MTELIEKYFDAEIIKAKAVEKNYDEISFDEYIRVIDQYLRDEEQYGFDEDSTDRILRITDPYMSLFVFERKKGFSVAWAKEYAFRCDEEEEEHAPAYAYVAVRDENAEQALQDLNLFARLTNRDESFIKHFEFLLKVDVPFPKISVERQADEYSKIYHQELAKGRSEIFANHYADMMAADDTTELGCYAEAAEYEKAVLAGYSEADALGFATDLSDYIANRFHNYEDALGDVLVKAERKRLEKKYQLDRV